MADNAALTTHPAPDHIDCLINRLPTELLTLLLQFALSLAPRSSLRSKDLYDDGGLLYYKELSLIRLVCKKWQCIVETNPSFWIYISGSIPPLLIKKVVERAPKTKSLFVYYNAGAFFAPPRRLLAADQGIVQLSEFWTTLHTQFASPEQLLQLLKQPVPHLRRLHVEHTGTTGTYKDVEFGFQSISFPLEILKVKDSIFPWNVSTITDLLEIDVECYDPCPYFSQGFIDVLCSSPRLQSLRLRFCRTDLQPQTSIILPHLASIDVAYSSGAAGLFKAITCPSSTKISICESTRSLSTQNPWIAAALDHTNFQCTEKVQLELRPDINVGVHVGNIKLTLRSGDRAYDSASIRPFCTDILKPFSETSGAQVTTLELGLDLEWNFAPLLSKLDSFFPNIDSLQLRCYADDHVSSAVFRALSQPFAKEDGKRQWLLPKVEKLRIDWTGCSQPLADGVMEMIRSRCSPQKDSRAIEGDSTSPRPTRLREFYLEACGMHRSEGQELRTLFGNAVEFNNVWAL